MKFGRIDSLIILGGTQRVINFIRVAQDFGFNKILVVSGQRLLKSKLSSVGLTLGAYLTKYKISHRSVQDINDFPLEKYISDSTLGVSFGAPWIFSPATLQKFYGKLINAHGTDLPRNRGGGGFSWQMMNGQRAGCHLFHLIDEGIDSGNIIVRDKFNFPKSCRVPQDYQDFFEKSEILFFKDFFIKLTKRENFKEIKQSNKESTYFPRLATEYHGFINWNWQAFDTMRFIHAFNYPYAGASTFINGQRVRIKGEVICCKDGRFHPFMSGLVYRKYKGYLYVAANDQSLVIQNVYNEEKQDISSKIKLGDRFFTPSQYLDDALAFKAVYDVKGLK